MDVKGSQFNDKQLLFMIMGLRSGEAEELKQANKFSRLIISSVMETTLTIEKN